MNYYRVYGLNIASEINFPDEKSKLDPGKPDVIIKLGKFDFSSSKEIVKDDLFWINKDKNDYFLYWKEVGTFKVSEREIIVSPEKDVDEYTLNSYIIGPVLAAFLHQKGLLVLHASAVKIDDGAVAFLGYSGIGKSSVAMALNKKGYPLVTDDILVIQMDNEMPLVLPGLSQTKLSSEMINFTWNRKITPKITVGPEDRFYCAVSNFSKDPLPLKKIYILDESENSHNTSSSLQEMLMGLIHNSYCFIMFQNKAKSLNLRQCSKLMENTAVNLLKVNKSIEELPELVKKIEDDVFIS